MAKDPTHPIDLDNIDYTRALGTKLEFHHWTKQLENMVYLTEKGKGRALEIQRQVAKKNAA